MIEQKHTPGPWQFQICENESEYEILGPNHKNTIECEYIAVCMDCGQDTTEANARLIIAAPEMLKALQSVLQQTNYRDVTFDQWRRFIDEIANTAKEAIRKATGATP